MILRGIGRTHTGAGGRGGGTSADRRGRWWTRRRSAERWHAGGTGISVVAFHAHPDDEVLLSGGTLAALAAAGHRVTVVLATDGGAGLTQDPTGDTDRSGGSSGSDAPHGSHESHGLHGSHASVVDLAAVRRAESIEACARLGLPPPRWLGYQDSGEGPEPLAGSFSCVPVDDAAQSLAAVLRQVDATVLVIDDENGGYGHRDHRQVHRVGLAAAEIAGIGDVLEVTVDRRSLVRATRLCRLLPGLPSSLGARDLASSYTSADRITHRLQVGAVCGQKRAAMRAHRSQQLGGTQQRTLAVLAALPLPVFRLVLGREWFVHRGVRPDRRPAREFPAPRSSARSPGSDR